MKQKLLFLLATITAINLCACGKAEQADLGQKKNTYIYTTEEVKLCQIDGLRIVGEPESINDYSPTQDEIDNMYAWIIVQAMETSGDAYEQTDAWVGTHFDGIDTIKELKEACRQTVISEKESNAPYNNYEAAMKYVIDNSEIAPAKDTIKKATDRLIVMHKQDGKTAGYENFEEYLKECGYNSEEEFTQSTTFANERTGLINRTLIAKAIVDAAGIVVTDEDVEEVMKINPTYLDEDTAKAAIYEQYAKEYLYTHTTFVTEDGEEIEKTWITIIAEEDAKRE